MIKEKLKCLIAFFIADKVHIANKIVFNGSMLIVSTKKVFKFFSTISIFERMQETIFTLNYYL